MSHQLHQAYELKSTKPNWSFPSCTYSYLKVDEKKDIQSRMDSIFYECIKAELTIIPQDSFYLLTNRFRNDDSVSRGIIKTLHELKKYGVTFLLFPEFSSTLIDTIGKPRHTNFHLSISITFLESSNTLVSKTFHKSSKSSSYRRKGFFNKWYYENGNYREAQLKAIRNMSIDIGNDISNYINGIDKTLIEY